MEDNEDEPDDVKIATPVEEEIARGEFDEHSGRTSKPIELGRKRHRCEKNGAKKLKKSIKNEGDCCRGKAAKASRAPKTATVLVYAEKECIFPKINPIPRHCLTKEEWIDILATPSRKCPSPCLQREVTRRIRPVSNRMMELAQPPKSRLLNTLQDRAATLPTELVDNLIQTLEGEACLTPEQAERMFRDKDTRARKKSRKKRNKLNCNGKKSSKLDSGISLNASTFDKEAVNCQYLMAESFVKSILEWKCPIPREEFKDIAEVILKRLGYVLEYNPVNGEDRKSQQMRFLADIVASWISGVLFDVAEAQKTQLEEECEKRRKEQEEESEEDSTDESMEGFRMDDDDDDDDDGMGSKKKKEGKGKKPKKGKDDKGKKGRKDDKDDDDDKYGKPGTRAESKEDKGGEDVEKPGTEDAEEELKEDDEKEPEEEAVEEDESQPQDVIEEPELNPDEEKAKAGESIEAIEPESNAVTESPEIAAVDISESLVEPKEIEATPIAIDEEIISEEPPIEPEEKVAIEAGKPDEDEEAMTIETDERAAGDRNDDEELPVETTRTSEASKILGPKEKEFTSVDAGDMGDEAKGDTTVVAPVEDSKTLTLVEGYEMELKKDEVPKKILKITSSKRKPSKIPSSIALIRRKKLQTDTPFLTFDKIFHTVYNVIEASRENPGVDAITNRIHRVIYEKCSNIVQDEKPEPLPEITKDMLEVLSGKLALWLRDVLTESQLSFMNNFPATVESVEVREWSKWIGYVSDTADTWSTWIQKTIKQAEAMRSGKITRGDWLDWTKSVEEDALLWRRFYLESLHQAHQNLTMIRDRRVVKTGARNLSDSDYEREMKITDLEEER